ncbi:MAG: thiazole synthase [Deltaproteobacteria bacterium]|nr:thiazole synthase [Deltaproteobacteria bacterium]
MLNDKLIIAGQEYSSRLLVGTGKYKDFEETKRAIEASGAEIVTVAVRRVNITKRDEPNLLDYIDPKKYTILPNTAGCYTAEDAIRTCRLAREGGGWKMVKLEVLGDQKTLFPDIPATLEAAKVLVKEGFIVMAYTSDDPITAKRLEEMGCAAVMPLGAPIGSGLGIRNPYNIMIILENAKVPILVDAGVGTASDAAIAMELGCDGVLMNTGIAGAKNPILMASAMKKAVEAGREAFLAGRIPTLGRPLLNVVKAALEAGVRIVQLREKALSGNDLFNLAMELRLLTRKYGARLLINDRIDIAIAAEADGVHLGHQSIAAQDARRAFESSSLIPHPSSFLIGVSTHSLEEALQAQSDGADFITFGPVYFTPSKAAYGQPVGTDKLKEAAEVVNIPIYALGGIRRENIEDVLRVGCYGVAMISAIMSADDVKKESEDIFKVHPLSWLPASTKLRRRLKWLQQRYSSVFFLI